MYQDTPNSEYLDPPIERWRELYSYERMKGLDRDSLHNKELELENEVMKIREGFPPEESFMQGGFRKYVIGDNKKALTPEEKQRLDLVKQELRDNIRRARADKKDEMRKHRRRTVELICDTLTKMIYALSWVVAKILEKF